MVTIHVGEDTQQAQQLL
jgi:hypothetical protein